MGESKIFVGGDYKKFVYDFHESMHKNHLSLIYEGEVNQEITNVFSEMAEASIKDEAETVRKRVYHVMVECLQNICKHSDVKGFENDKGKGKGVLMVSNDIKQHIITTGNLIFNDKIPALEKMLDEFNSLDTVGIKKKYKQMIREARLSDKGGAGLGFIDMIKKTGNPIEYLTHKVDNDRSFLVIVSRINRDN